MAMPAVSVHEVIQVHRRYLVELMQQWTRLKEDEAEFDLGLALVVDAELSLAAKMLERERKAVDALAQKRSSSGVPHALLVF